MNFAKFLKTPFSYLGNLTFRLLILNKFVPSINIVGMLYLMSRNVDFAFYDPKTLENILVLRNLIFFMIIKEQFLAKKN